MFLSLVFCLNNLINQFLGKTIHLNLCLTIFRIISITYCHFFSVHKVSMLQGGDNYVASAVLSAPLHVTLFAQAQAAPFFTY